LRAALRQVGEERYHHKHPFHLLMHEGKLSRGQLQAWALNRYYYQSIIPIKDAIILSRAIDPAFRRSGASALWIMMAKTVTSSAMAAFCAGSSWRKRPVLTKRERVMSAREVLPATRFIGNEYLNLVRTRSFLECVASSLTELFSRDLISLRMDRLRQHYPYLASALDYFEARLTEAPEDAAFAIQYVFDHAATRGESRRARSRHCATSATFSGRNSTRSISRMWSRDGRRRGRFAMTAKHERRKAWLS
jgi:pyrroloquinoline-quinone synthase